MPEWLKLKPAAIVMAMALMTVSAGAETPSPPAPLAALEVSGPTGRASLTPADLAGLPSQSVTVRWHDHTVTYTGPLLADVLARVGAPHGDALHRPDLADIVILTAQDGYRVALGLAETDASVRPNRMILALQADGHPLTGADGTVRLVIEGDLKPARSERQVARIEVRRLD